LTARGIDIVHLGLSKTGELTRSLVPATKVIA
jgi:hypothetical protein